MRYIMRFFVLMPLFFCLLTVSALAADQGELTDQIQNVFDQAAAGFVARDVTAVLAFATPETTLTYRDGSTLSMKQWGEAVAKEFADWRDVSSTFTVEKAWATGANQAGAVYTEQHQFSRNSDPGHTFVISARFEAELLKTAEGWRFLKFTELDDTRQTRDGQPLTKPSTP